MKWDIDGRDWPNREFSRFVAMPGLRWHVQEAGPQRNAGTETAAPTALLLHGAGASCHSWRDVLPDLARDHRVIAIDLPGQGFTQTTMKQRLGLATMAADIRALLAAEAIAPDLLVGHSAGAAIAMRLALDLPRRPRGVVAVNGAFESFRGLAGAIFPIAAKLLSLNPLTAPAFARLARAPGFVRRLLDATGSRIDARGEALYRRLLCDTAHVDATLSMMAQWDVEPLRATVAKLSAPILLLVGSEDRSVPPDTSARLARIAPSADLHSIAGLGHLLHEEDPERATEEIRRFGARCID